MKFADRYAGAVSSSNLGSKPDTTYSDSDVIGAAGLAAKRVPLGMALLRLFSGDNHSVGKIVDILAEMAWKRRRMGGRKPRRVECEDIARAVLAWHRDGTCKVCGGHGVGLIPGTPTLGGDQCRACKGTGRVLFERQFPVDRLDLARWLAAELEREMADAGPEAMRKLAPRLEI